jgi:hypothetical protein
VVVDVGIVVVVIATVVVETAATVVVTGGEVNGNDSSFPAEVEQAVTRMRPAPSNHLRTIETITRGQR